jgi:hypothetical protein
VPGLLPRYDVSTSTFFFGARRFSQADLSIAVKHTDQSAFVLSVSGFVSQHVESGVRGASAGRSPQGLSTAEKQRLNCLY